MQQWSRNQGGWEDYCPPPIISRNQGGGTGPPNNATGQAWPPIIQAIYMYVLYCTYNHIQWRTHSANGVE